MGIMDFIKGELIDVIEWTDDSNGQRIVLVGLVSLTKRRYRDRRQQPHLMSVDLRRSRPVMG